MQYNHRSGDLGLHNSPALAVKGGKVLEHAALLAEAMRLATQRHYSLGAVELADPVALIVLLLAGQAACAALDLHKRHPFTCAAT
jgi:hypothetical protein